MKKFILHYFLFLICLLSIFSSGVIDSQDGFQYLAVARNIYYTGKPTAPIYEYNTHKNIHMSAIIGKDGNTYSLTGLGYSLAYLPAVAITDIVYRIYDVSPPVHFPLENDWLIFLMAGFTNAFFGAILGVILLIYLILLGLSRKQAIFLSLISIFTTNLFVYTKHSMPHIMFITFLMLSFLTIKIYSMKRKSYILMISGLSFGIFMITYNPTFFLAIPPLFLYYILSGIRKWNNESIKLIFRDTLIFLIGVSPFILIYSWFENLRSFQNTSNLASLGISYIVSSVPVSVFFEGIYGQLLSPGRSIFIYSPLLLIIILFWHRMKKSIYPEFLTFILYAIILVVFYAKAYSVGGADQGIAALWHGEASWGPRYLLPLLPLGLLIVGQIYRRINKFQKLFIFLPLMIIGLYVQMLGVLIPYQTKFYNLMDFHVNNQEYRPSDYSNLLPRYSPILAMSKNLFKLAHNFPNTFSHGMYKVRFYDGIDFPFNVGPERWRSVEGKGYISFDNNQKNPVKELTFGLINHPLSTSSESARIQFILNNKQLLEQPFSLNITEREQIKIPVQQNSLKPKMNQLTIIVDYSNNKIIGEKQQLLALQSFDINSQRQNLESIDLPYVSSLGPKIAGVTYQNWGGTNKDPWKLWELHTQTFERIPDFWWVRNLFYWDIPKTWIIIPFALNIICLVFSGIKLKKHFRS